MMIATTMREAQHRWAVATTAGTFYFVSHEVASRFVRNYRSEHGHDSASGLGDLLRRFPTER